MNTQTHILLGLAVAGKPGDAKRNAAAIVGAFVPDMTLYALIGYAWAVERYDLRTIFDTLYFSPSWTRWLAPGNSFVVWGALLAVAIVRRRVYLRAFALAGFVHLMFDFPVHHDDAYMHFWPLTQWVFVSPVSYWDTAHYGGILSVIEGVSLLALAVYLWRTHRHPWLRVLVALLAPSLFVMHAVYMLALGIW